MYTLSLTANHHHVWHYVTVRTSPWNSPTCNRPTGYRPTSYGFFPPNLAAARLGYASEGTPKVDID